MLRKSAEWKEPAHVVVKEERHVAMGPVKRDWGASILEGPAVRGLMEHDLACPVVCREEAQRGLKAAQKIIIQQIKNPKKKLCPSVRY